MAGEKLILEFAGRCMIRQPTDPDPYDETRGVSGYTFAFGDEPDLNRGIYFQPDPAFALRSHCPPIGVRVIRAMATRAAGDAIPVPVLENARFDLLGDAAGPPALENRNWNLTRPGYEPIIPFHISITATQAALKISRLDVLDPQHPRTPVWLASLPVLETKGARGLAFEPATVGPATGIYDFASHLRARRSKLAADREALSENGGSASGGRNDAALAILDGRLHEIDFALERVEEGRPDRRTGVHPIVERFGYPVSGHDGLIEGEGLPFALDLHSPWRVDFWMGGWDFDALCCFVQGMLAIPVADA